MKIRVTTPAAAQLVSLGEARSHLRLTATGSPATHPDDDDVTRIIAAANDWTEMFLCRVLAPKSYELALDDFPVSGTGIQLLSPLLEITSVEYTDPDSLLLVSIDAANYYRDNFSEPGWVMPVPDYVWPDTAPVANSVRVKFRAGYTDNESPDTDPVPSVFKQGMLLVIGEMYEKRDASSYEPSDAVERLLFPYRLEMGL